MPLTAAHKAKISASLKKYHAGCRQKKCTCPPQKKYITSRKKPPRKYPSKPRVLKRLRRAGVKKPKATTKAKQPTADMQAYMRQMLSQKARGQVGAGAPAKKKKKRRVALTKAARPKTAMVKRSLTAGQLSEYKAVRRLGKKSKRLKGRDAAPEWAFSITDRWANDTGM